MNGRRYGLIIIYKYIIIRISENYFKLKPIDGFINIKVMYKMTGGKGGVWV